MKLLGLALSASLLVALPACAQQTTAPRTITVQGSGSAAARPDMVVVRAGVETRAPTPQAALDTNTAEMRTVLEVFKKHGFADRDIATTTIDVQPLYGRADPQGGTPPIQGYQVSNQVSAKLRDIERLGTLLTDLVQGGANRLRGISFEIANPEAVQNEARHAAFADAKRRAELYAQAAGVTLGRVLAINETESPVLPMPRQMRIAAMAAESVPVAPGEQTVNAGVSVAYAID